MTLTMHPSECGPCADCREAIDTIAQKIADETDRQIVDAFARGGLVSDVQRSLDPEGDEAIIPLSPYFKITVDGPYPVKAIEGVSRRSQAVREAQFRLNRKVVPCPCIRCVLRRFLSRTRLRFRNWRIKSYVWFRVAMRRIRS